MPQRSTIGSSTISAQAPIGTPTAMAIEIGTTSRQVQRRTSRDRERRARDEIDEQDGDRGDARLVDRRDQRHVDQRRRSRKSRAPARPSAETADGHEEARLGDGGGEGRALGSSITAASRRPCRSSGSRRAIGGERGLAMRALCGGRGGAINGACHERPIRILGIDPGPPPHRLGRDRRRRQPADLSSPAARSRPATRRALARAAGHDP